MGHFGLIWGFGFLIMQPVIGYGYLKGIRESAPDSFNTIMLGDKAWVFNLLVLWIAVLSIASTAYFVHKLRFTVNRWRRCASSPSAPSASPRFSRCSTLSRPTLT